MKKIKISTDSVSDLGSEILKERDIGFMPLMINMGETAEEDGEGMPDKIYAFVEKTGKLPKTAARSAEDYKEFFKKIKPENGEVVHFTISSKLSASFEMASIAAKEIGGVHVVDTRSLSTGSGLCVLHACDLADEGTLTGEEIANACRERTAAVQASFILDSLEFLHKGGRCSGLKLFIASVFKIKPMICLINGEMKPGKKYKGRIEREIFNYVDDVLNTFTTPDLKRCFITFTTAPEGIVDKVKERVLARYPFAEVIPTIAGGTVTSHCGKNTLGILYFNDGKKE